MKRYLLFIILLLSQFIAYGQKVKTDGIYVFDGGKSKWYDNELFVRFYEGDSLIFGQFIFPEDTNPDSMGQYLNGLTYVKRAYQRTNDKITFIEEKIYDEKIIEYNILLTSDSTLWLKCNDNMGKINEVPTRFKYIDVDYLDRNFMFIDTHVYKIISNMPGPKRNMADLKEDIYDTISKSKKAEKYDGCFSVFTVVVLEDGSCTDWTIDRSKCWDIVEDILEEFKKTSPWNPGTHVGRRVKCRFILPCKYTR